MGKAGNSYGNIENGMRNTVYTGLLHILNRDIDSYSLGPIVRIGPNEVHIQDSDFYYTLFLQKLDKPKRWGKKWGNSDSAFVTYKHEAHRPRRAAVNPFFSTRKIALSSPNIQNRVNRLCDRLDKEFAGSGQVLVMDDMWGCLTSDTIVDYCFDRPYHYIELPDFRADFVKSMYDLMDNIHMASQFSWIMSLFDKLPDSVVRIIQPKMASVVAFRNVSTLNKLFSHRRLTS